MNNSKDDQGVLCLVDDGQVKKGGLTMLFPRDDKPMDGGRIITQQDTDSVDSYGAEGS